MAVFTSDSRQRGITTTTKEPSPPGNMWTGATSWRREMTKSQSQQFDTAGEESAILNTAGEQSSSSFPWLFRRANATCQRWFANLSTSVSPSWFPQKTCIRHTEPRNETFANVQKQLQRNPENVSRWAMNVKHEINTIQTRKLCSFLFAERNAAHYGIRNYYWIFTNKLSGHLSKAQALDAT